ncbi:DUF4192 family protein [Paramicrobacterium chengjingii]|uniref:DUF4192 domain-containing protein n=1 Tax=Paramicrobacterium chengjingii TaxID=2769067 RepID=A0ABX6YF66_9MICO|nr:DUF4192 family protein [Microbacterium chengjingii]QPZ37225.1 DUF4192 domain-containing protein [Microbacterium chengjingii]
MITTSRVSLSAPHELLSYVPALVGMHPIDSVVFVAFRDQSTCGAMRLDRGVFTRTETGDTAIEAALDAVTRIPRLTGVLVVVYTTDSFADAGGIPHESLAAMLAPRIEKRGLAVVDMLCVAADAWGGYLDDTCCGHDLAQIAQPDDLPSGSVLDTDAELRLPEVGPDERKIFERAREVIARVPSDALSQESAPGRADGSLPQDGSEFAAAMASYVVDGTGVLDAELAFIAHLIDEPVLRDVIAYSWAWGADAGTHLWNRVVEPELFTTESIDDPWMYAFAGRIEVRPDVEHLRTAITLLKRMCALQHPEDRAPGLTLISWCYWALGLSSFSAEWQRQAVTTDGTYGLAIIMRMILDAGMNPDWAFYDPDELYSDAADPVADDSTS